MEAALEDVLRAAAARVSSSSANYRLRLFRYTLPPLVEKATDSPSETVLLVDLIFQTLPIYDDQASQKAVDDMVIQALGEPTFMKPFAAVLVQSMEENPKVTNSRRSFKLLRWSQYLLKWSQFATLSKDAFTRLANAQAVLCQVLMDGSIRQRRTCKQLFIQLLSEPSGICKMYIEELRGLRISMRDNPAFLNLILDFTITSPSLSTEYKSVFLDLYVKTILSSKDQQPSAASKAFKPLFLGIGHEDFKNTLMPSCIKMLKRNPEIILQSIGYLLKTVCLDLSKYSMEFMPVVLHQARHSDEGRRVNALSIIGTLSEKSSDPDALPSMVNAIKAVLGGLEGKMSFPYQIIGTINALAQLSRSPLKQIGRLAPSVSSYLIACYKDDGIEEVKLAILSAIGSWTLVSAEAVQPDVVSFIAAGLKEKDTLRKGHLKFLRVICKNSDSLTKVASLLDHLIQLSKTGFSKVTQRLDGIYALFAVSRLAAVDTKADGAILKEKLWTLIAQNEPSLISLQLLPKLADDDCLAVLDLLQSLLVEHFFRVREYFSIQSLLQLLIYLLCHPSWEVRKVAYDATKKIFSSSSGLAEDVLVLFTDWLSLVGERLSILKQGDMDSSSDSQLPFIPSTEVLVKCLFLIAPYDVVHSTRSYSRITLCSHHPCLSSSSNPTGVFKRLQRRLRQEQIFFVDLITPNISVICKELLSQDGLFSSNKQVQSAALNSLLTLMTITPDVTFLEFEKHFRGLQERTLHDSFSESDIKTAFINSIDAASLPLLVPFVHRGLRGRGIETKMKAAQIVGSMSSLVTNPKDMIPYISLLLPEIKKVLLDPIPEVRAVAARALGSLISGMGEEIFPDLVPWLFDTLKSDNSNVEQYGAAEGLSEVLAALGQDYFDNILPEIIKNCSHPKASVRDGHLTLLQYLPRSLGGVFQNHLELVLSAILDGFADEKEFVRDAALSAGHIFVEHYATMSLPLLLRAIEDGIFSDNWCIRQSSVELLGGLLLKVARTSGKAILEGGSDDEGASTEAQEHAIIEVLGREKYNEVLVAIYMVCSDVSSTVRQAALDVWKKIVANTPRTLKEIMPVLMDTLISSLASSSSERRQIAGRSLGDLVRKLGETVVPLIFPILSQGLKDPSARRRRGVCIGLIEVMGSAVKCGENVDEQNSVRKAAETVLLIIDEEGAKTLIPELLRGINDSQASMRRGSAYLIGLLFKNTKLDLADEASDMMSTLIILLSDTDKATVSAALEAFSGIVAALPIEELPTHIKLVRDAVCRARNQEHRRQLEDVTSISKKSLQGLSILVPGLCLPNALQPFLPIFQQGLISGSVEIKEQAAQGLGELLDITSAQTLKEVAVPVTSTLICILGDQFPWQVKSAILSTLTIIIRKGGIALKPVLPQLQTTFVKCLQHDNRSVRMRAAAALGKLSALSTRVGTLVSHLLFMLQSGDESVKESVLSALKGVIKHACKSGVALKPVLPQLQTTFVKCLQDNNRSVQKMAADALGKLSACTPVEPLVSDLLSILQSGDESVKESVLYALKSVIKHGGKSVSSAVWSRGCASLEDLLQSEADDVRSCAAKVIGALSQYMDETEFSDLLQILSRMKNSSYWCARDGAESAITSITEYRPIKLSNLRSFLPTPMRHSSEDDKVPEDDEQNVVSKEELHLPKAKMGDLSDNLNSERELQTFGPGPLVYHPSMFARSKEGVVVQRQKRRDQTHEVIIDVNENNGARPILSSEQIAQKESKRRWCRFSNLAASVAVFHGIMLGCSFVALKFVASEMLKTVVIASCWLLLSIIFVWWKLRVDKKYGVKSTFSVLLAQTFLHLFSLYVFSILEHAWSENEFSSIVLAHVVTLCLDLGGSLIIMLVSKADIDIEGSDF